MSTEVDYTALAARMGSASFRTCLGMSEDDVSSYVGGLIHSRW